MSISQDETNILEQIANEHGMKLKRSEISESAVDAIATDYRYMDEEKLWDEIESIKQKISPLKEIIKKNETSTENIRSAKYQMKLLDHLLDLAVNTYNRRFGRFTTVIEDEENS